MRIDLYTKTVLTLIALLLAVVAITPLVRPNAVAAQPGQNPLMMQPTGLQFTATRGGGIWFLDPRNGDVWLYDPNSPSPHGSVESTGDPTHYRLVELGKRLLK